MSDKKYRIVCSECKNPNKWEVVTTTVHPIKELDIYLLDVPCFWCNECGAVAYRKVLGIHNILTYAYSNGHNVVLFEQEDYEGLFNQELI